MPELVILCNEQLLFCNSTAYNCDGSVSIVDVGSTAVTVTAVAYVSVVFNTVEYNPFLVFVTSDNEILVTSNGNIFYARDSLTATNMRY